MRMFDVIAKKRDGLVLTKSEIDQIIAGISAGEIPDYQTSALLMAIYFQGMTQEEQSQLTQAMANSGDKLDLSHIAGIKVDKHSTGGVGDTTTLVLIPLVASLGVPIAKMSGRGLGHTGGTLDKLESVPGFNIELTAEQFANLVNEYKLALVGQSGNITPADKKLYSLRDVTATVNSIPLIASSIMSKKIAAGADAIILDVKTGSGAFMEKFADAKELAEAMVKIGNDLNRKTMAVISDMSQPLGFAIGNALEVKEAIDTLRGDGPEDLTELCLALGSQMVVAGGKAKDLAEASEKLQAQIRSGAALDKFREFLRNQGGDDRIVDEPELLPQASERIELTAKTTGFIAEMNANEIGTACMMLGAGRKNQDSIIDLAVGIELHKKIGDKVNAGESLLTIHANSMDHLEEIKDKLYQNIIISPKQSDAPKLIYEMITK